MGIPYLYLWQQVGTGSLFSLVFIERRNVQLDLAVSIGANPYSPRYHALTILTPAHATSPTIRLLRTSEVLRLTASAPLFGHSAGTLEISHWVSKIEEAVFHDISHL